MAARPKASHAAPAPIKLPKTLGACADALYNTRQDRLVEQKDVAEKEAYEKAIKAHLIAVLPKSDAKGVSGKVARVTITSKTIPIVEDWDKLYAYIRKTKRFDLLQRRLNEAAIDELWEDGKEVPGVGQFVAVGVSVNKV